MDVDALKEQFAVLERQHWPVPEDLRVMCGEAEEKDARLRKTLELKLTPQEMAEVARDVAKEKVKTLSMKLLLEDCERARRWIENAEDISDKWVSIKTLNRMVTDSRSLKITSSYIEDVGKRYDKAKDWYNFYIIIA